jgi:hypothetical protein
MKAENARPTRGTGALESAGWPENRVTQIGPLCGCPLDHHECDQAAPTRDVVCGGRCKSFGVHELVDIGRRYGGCPCSSASQREAS